jgi:hypothetical protein
MQKTEIYPNKATKALVRRLRNRSVGSELRNVAVWAKTLNVSYSEMRTAFQWAVDRNILSVAGGSQGKQKVFVRTSIPTP